MKISIKQIYSKLDSFDIYSIFKDEQNVIFLDSAMNSEEQGRYSFIGVNPFITIKGDGSNCLINGERFDCNVFDKISELLKEYEFETKQKIDAQIPFPAGCIGYFSYDLGLSLENIKKAEDDEVVIPEYYFNFYDNIIIFDHIQGKTYISACGVLESNELSTSLLEERISNHKKVKCADLTETETVFNSNFTQIDYKKTVGTVKKHIENGDVYIVNLTQRFSAITSKDADTIYHHLRTINPAPFAALMKLDGFEVISSSPERFISIRDKMVETRPIKGTRPRGQNETEDLQNKIDLLNSEKDKAELLMIVDLERNDLSKVCNPHSVKVPELFKLEEYSTVFHLVATVQGEMREGVDAVSCFKACFPGGSITGAPKRSAMQIIKELEGINRSLYTGCIGYFSFNGNADFNIVIRTIIKKDEKVYFGVGGGITCESDEQDEYQETLDKAKALMRVIK